METPSQNEQLTPTVSSEINQPPKVPVRPAKNILIALAVLLFLIATIAGIFFLGQGNNKQTTTKPKLTEATTTLIPRKDFFKNPDKSLVRLSPDGTKISFMADVNGVANVWVGPSDKPSQAKPITHDTGRGIDTYQWTFTNNHILYRQDEKGDENWRIYSIDVTMGTIKDLTPLKGVAAQIQQVSDKFPNEILIGLNDRVPELYDLYRINIITGEKKLVMKNDEFAGFVTDYNYKVRFALRQTDKGEFEVFEYKDNGDKELYATIPFEDANTTDFIGFDESGNTLYMKDSRKRNTSALFAIDLTTGKQTVLAENDNSDVDTTFIHPGKKTVQAVTFYYDRQKWQVIDNDIKGDFDYLASLSEGDVLIPSRTLDDNQWIIAYLFDNGPFNYYKYDRKAKKANFLFNSRDNFANLPLASMQSVVIKTRDGLTMVSYLTLPPWVETNQQGKPNAPLPMVLNVHGGPWARDEWGYNPENQWLANRGYAILNVNYRGSTGFGKNFINASTREWGRKMQDDLTDAVNWAIKEGVADPKRVAIMGGSYGGYATLAGLTYTPELFVAGVDTVGPSNLVTFMETIPAYWQPQVEYLKKMIGDNTTPEGKAFLTDRSPLTHVDKITKPLLIAQGANDPRVKQAEPDQIVQAMQKKKIPVTYALYSDEGHGFARPENQYSFYAITEAFLGKYLGGRVEPFGDSFKDSSVEIKAGIDLIPNLQQAIPASPSVNKQ